MDCPYHLFDVKWTALIQCRQQVQPRGQLPTALGHTGMAVLSNASAGQPSLFVFGGFTLTATGNNATDELWEFSLALQTWRLHRLPDSPAARYGHAVFTLANLQARLVVFGGHSYNEMFNHSLVYVLSLVAGELEWQVYPTSLRQSDGNQCNFTFSHAQAITAVPTQSGGRIVSLYGLINETQATNNVCSLDLACPPGFYSANFSLFPCAPCSVMTYSTVAGATECKLCPNCTMAAGLGSTSIHQCSMCADAGYCSHGSCSVDPDTHQCVCHCPSLYLGQRCDRALLVIPVVLGPLVFLAVVAIVGYRRHSHRLVQDRSEKQLLIGKVSVKVTCPSCAQW